MVGTMNRQLRQLRSRPRASRPLDLPVIAAITVVAALVASLGACAGRGPAAPAPPGQQPAQHAGQRGALARGHATSDAPDHSLGDTSGHAHSGGHPSSSHDHRAGMPHDFKGAEQWAKVFDDPARDAWQRPDEVVALLQLAPGHTVADLGAGTGYFVGRLAAQVGPTGTVLATDVEPDMIRYLTERGQREGWRNVRAMQVPPDDPQLPAASVDRVLVVDVWHHLGDRAAYAAKLAAALRPAGFVIVVDFTLESPHGPPAKHRLAPEVILAELRSAGLVAELARESLPDQFVVIGRRPAR
jgi:Methyltransferase domain